MTGTERVVAIVHYLLLCGTPKGLTEISKELFVSGSTAYRILSSLKKVQWVVQNSETKKYSIGVGLLELSLVYTSQFDLRNVSMPYLKQLVTETHEAAMLSVRTDLERMFIEQLQSDHELKHIVEIGKRLPLWLGAPGKVMLSYMEEKEIEMVIDTFKQLKVHILASGQATGIENLRKELADIRKKGFAVSSGERIVGTTAVAATIFGAGHRVVGAISVGGPLPRFGTNAAVRYGPLIREVAKEISLKLSNSSENFGYKLQKV